MQAITTFSAPAFPDFLRENVDRFRSNAQCQRSAIRDQFIDELFIALGWDVHNITRRDVIHEDKIRQFGRGTSGHKAPDYGFYIGPPSELNLRFYVEAKQPSVNHKRDPSPAYPLRLYAWSANLSISVLTDFEELAVYDARVRPKRSDSCRIARIFYCNFEAYEEQWQTIWSLLSRDAILAGSLESFGEQKHRGSESIEQAFLGELEVFRKDLANDIISHNSELLSSELNRSVQLILDRIVFLRIVEDRGMDLRYGRLLEAARGEGVYAALLQIFKQADAQYNSGLFHFQHQQEQDVEPDTVSPRLTISDTVLRNIIEKLYDPNAYAFDVIASDILGSVYEHFLGTEIRVSPSDSKVNLEFKNHTRRNQGVYYTPAHIVDFIVSKTVGASLSKKSLQTADSVKILDPTCGSGAFLVRVYAHLLDWYTQQYAENNPQTHAGRRPPPIRKSEHDEWVLTFAERKRILQTHIFGVDLDAQAIEVTKRSLLLKLMENTALEFKQQTMNVERVMPNLSENIKRGNVLIGTEDWMRDRALVDRDELNRVSPLEMSTAFPSVFLRANPGFDVVLGNPPYLKEYTSTWQFNAVKETSVGQYYQGKMDLWYLFACRSIDLTRNGGLHSFIATNSWPTQAGASKLRHKLLNETNLHFFVDFGPYMVFDQASIQTMVYVTQKTGNPNAATTQYVRFTHAKLSKSAVTKALDTLTSSPVLRTLECSIAPTADAFTFVDNTDASIINKIERAGPMRLSQKEMTQGILAPQEKVISKHLDAGIEAAVGDGIFILSKEEAAHKHIETELLRPFFTTAQILRFGTRNETHQQLVYVDSKQAQNMSVFPQAREHLNRFKKVNTSDNKPYGLHRARKESFFTGPKILALRKTARPCFSYSDFPCFVSQTFNVIGTQRADMEFLTGLLNSSLLAYWFLLKGKRQGNHYQIDSGPLRNAPLMEGSDDGIIALVRKLSHLYLQHQDERDSAVKELLSRAIRDSENQLDDRVFDLYGLNAKERTHIKRTVNEQAHA